MTQIIASIIRSLRYEALLVKRTRLTEMQLFTAVGHCMKKKEARDEITAIRKNRNKSLFFTTRTNTFGVYVNIIYTS